MNNQIRVLKVEPGKAPEVTMIENTLEAMQQMSKLCPCCWERIWKRLTRRQKSR